jgi:2-phosphosulfolactate phosphatase
MNIQTCTLDTCAQARGTVAAVDVVRAFTSAAFAFAAGVRQIFLVGSVDEALDLKARFPGALAMGEMGGMPVEGFDYWNSPAQLQDLNLTGKTLIQRTSAGTQGIVRSTGADRLFAASFVVAGSTARAIRAAGADEITFVITGLQPENPRSGSEDLACARYITALLRNESPDPLKYLDWSRTFLEGRLDGAPDDLLRTFAADVALCTQVDRFPFAMEVQRKDGLLIMEKIL